MKDISIQYPDGRFHTVRVYRFYSVMYNGKEEFVIEYDDLTDNVRGCFTILDRENNIFVKRPLADSAAYRVFYNSIRFMYKKPQAIYLLPNTINLCRSALEALAPYAPPVHEVTPPVRTQTRRQVVVFRDISPNHDAYPYYIDQATARALGFMCSGPYYHLNPSLMESLRRAFDVVEQDIQLNLVIENKPGKKPATQAAAAGSPPPPPPPPGGGNGGNNNNPPGVFRTATKVPSKGPNKVVETVTVYEDISPIREEFPFYLTQYDAKRFGLKVDENKPYYHLKKEEFDVISRYAIVVLEKKELAILPQKRRRVTKQTPVAELNSKEVETLENLFESLMDFEDYYSFFGIEELRDAPAAQVLSSPRIIALTNLFNKGKECGNDLAINLAEFLEGFKKELIEKGKKF